MRHSNKQKSVDAHREWIERNREHASAYDREYRETHREQIQRKERNYALRHPDRIRAKTRKRDALKIGNGHLRYIEADIYTRDKWCCRLCGARVNRRLKWPHPKSPSLDHIVPLSTGGADAPANVQLAHLRCNLRKSTRAIGQLWLAPLLEEATTA